MIKLLLFFLLFSYSALSCFAFQIDARPTPGSESQKPVASHSPEPLTLELDRTVLETYCPLEAVPEPRSCDQKVARIKVTTRNNDTIDKRRSYYYQVSGGRILGSGPEVIWELETSTPGTYTIQASTGSNRILDGSSARSELVIRVCPVCDPGCACPSVKLLGPSGSVKPGDRIVIEAEIGWDDPASLSKQWSVIGGEILSGEGTSSIIVRVDGSAGNVQANLKLPDLDVCCWELETTSITIPVLR